MADRVTQQNIGAYVAAVTSVAAQSITAAVNGSSIDRQAHSTPLSCVLHLSLGAVGGAPSAIGAVAKIQHAPDNSSWVDYKPDGVNVATTAALASTSATEQETSLSVDLSLASRFLRVVVTPNFTGGTSPSVLGLAELILGGEQTLAAV